MEFVVVSGFRIYLDGQDHILNPGKNLLAGSREPP